MEGKTVYRYRILEKIGEGGMGEVYLAEDTSLQRRVALKFLPTHLYENDTARRRFLREARSAAAIDHPYVCKVYETAEVDDISFIAMEYVEGQTLLDKLAKGRVPLKEALQIASEVAEALEVAHKKGVVHRDLKPSNIMLTEQGHAKVMDFGLAKYTETPEGPEGQVTAPLTREGSTLGTLYYMSPEQVRAEEVDARSDIFSFGIVLYEMLTGEHPFRRATQMATVSAILSQAPPPITAQREGVPKELEQIVERMLAKAADERYQEVEELRRDLEKCFADLVVPTGLGSLLHALLKTAARPQVAVPLVLVVLVAITSGYWFFNRQAKIRWAREKAIPEIEQLIETSWRDYTDAYELAKRAEEYIPNDPKLSELFSKCSFSIHINTEPSGAGIYIQEYEAPDSAWEFLGVSPIEGIGLPIGIFRWKIEKDGYEQLMAAESSWDLDLSKRDYLIPRDFARVLDQIGEIPPGMVRVTHAETDQGYLEDFYIDKYEVTNRQFKEFIDRGGYRNRQYWKHEFKQDGTTLSWEEAMAEFVDQTDRPGPATWQAGDYREGEDEYPVSGISWYEAAAYAEFMGKSLPTGTHWGLARGEYVPWIMHPWLGGFAVIAPFANFDEEGPTAAGSHNGITAFGAYDMAGNVREWCWNETPHGRLVRGGAWNDTTYMFKKLSQAPPFDRSAKNGFRCALYLDSQNIPESVYGIVKPVETRDLYKVEPVSDSIFQIYREQFSYDETDLNVRLESRDEGSNEWIQERVTFNAAYGNERIIACLFLPKNVAPPYQTVVYFPGAGSRYQQSSENLENCDDFRVFLSFLVKNGRAVLYPVYKGTFERRDKILAGIQGPDDSHLWVGFLVQLVKDFRRCIDYLETRPDIDSDKLAYYGMSWGGRLGAIIPAVEARLKVSVLLSGGMHGLGRPEVNPVNYASRVTVPTLMVNGKYDTDFPYETSIKPMFDLLGTPDGHKELRLFETDHVAPSKDCIRETLAWLDHYLGPVEFGP